MIKTLTWWLLSRRQRSKHNRKETNYPVSLISFVKENPYLSFTLITIHFLHLSGIAGMESRITIEDTKKRLSLLPKTGTASGGMSLFFLLFCKASFFRSCLAVDQEKDRTDHPCRYRIADRCDDTLRKYKIYRFRIDKDIKDRCYDHP